MASGNLLCQFNSQDLFRETGLGYNPYATSALYQTANGASRGAA